MTLTFTSGDYSGRANELDRARFEGSCHSRIVAMHVVMLPKMGLDFLQKLVFRLGLGLMGAARDDVITYKLKHSTTPSLMGPKGIPTATLAR